MNTRSRKQKGRTVQNKVKELLRQKYLSVLAVENINTTLMGESGRDVKLSPLAEQFIPFDIEVKCHEKLNIWSALEQSEGNTKNGRIPLLVFKRNHSKLYACLEFEKLLKLL